MHMAPAQHTPVSDHMQHVLRIYPSPEGIRWAQMVWKQGLMLIANKSLNQ